MKAPAIPLFIALALFAAPAMAHDHYPAGVLDSNHNNQPDPGEPLRFVPFSYSGYYNWNDTTTPQKIFHLLPRPYGANPSQHCGGYYMLQDSYPRTAYPADEFSLIALSDGQNEGEPIPGHACTGAWLWAEIVSVTGPDGGQLGWWDSGTPSYNDTPTVTYFANQPVGTRTPLQLDSPADRFDYPFSSYPSNRFVLSEGYNFGDQDPEGHIHERGWTATKAGDYYVGIRLLDLSNSNNGGSWHTPSQTYTFHFQAGPDFTPTWLFTKGVSMKATWKSQMGVFSGQQGMAFQFERATTLSPPNWTLIGTVNAASTVDNTTSTFTDSSLPAGQAFYRMKYLWNPGGNGSGNALAAAREPEAALVSSTAASDSVAAVMNGAALTATVSHAASAIVLRNAAIIWNTSTAVRLAQLQSFFVKARAANTDASGVKPKKRIKPARKPATTNTHPQNQTRK